MDLPVYVQPTCPRCGGHNFGIKEIPVQNANYRHFAILCTSCGCVVGAETMQDDERINQLKSELSAIKQELNNISNSLRRHGIY